MLVRGMTRSDGGPKYQPKRGNTTSSIQEGTASAAMSMATTIKFTKNTIT